MYEFKFYIMIQVNIEMSVHYFCTFIIYNLIITTLLWLIFFICKKTDWLIDTFITHSSSIQYKISIYYKQYVT